MNFNTCYKTLYILCMYQSVSRAFNVFLIITKLKSIFLKNEELIQFNSWFFFRELFPEKIECKQMDHTFVISMSDTKNVQCQKYQLNDLNLLQEKTSTFIRCKGKDYLFFLMQNSLIIFTFIVLH